MKSLPEYGANMNTSTTITLSPGNTMSFCLVGFVPLMMLREALSAYAWTHPHVWPVARPMSWKTLPTITSGNRCHVAWWLFVRKMLRPALRTWCCAHRIMMKAYGDHCPYKRYHSASVLSLILGKEKTLSDLLTYHAMMDSNYPSEIIQQKCQCGHSAGGSGT